VRRTTIGIASTASRPPERRFARWRARAAELKAEAQTLYLACRDPRVPWYAKLLAAAVVAYALSPIDLIPDFIPVLGQLDDLIIVPLGIALAIRLMPRSVYEEHRRTVDIRCHDEKDRRR
jgi:uncharacterized membrane protein YkvA (DUF1232 family)